MHDRPMEPVGLAQQPQEEIPAPQPVAPPLTEDHIEDDDGGIVIDED